MGNNNDQNLNNLRHSTAHLLAAAVLALYPDTLLTIGPAIEDGFYYDFDLGGRLSDEDFPKIEKKMGEILKTWTGFTHREVSEKEAREIYKDNPFKLELIDEIVKKGEKITLYKAGPPAGGFEDLCRGGHSENPVEDIGAFKLMSIAGAYWRGSEKNKMLTRIYGTCFPTKKELDDYLAMLEEARKRDHKKLGLQLDLFMFHETSPGMAYWLPKGLLLYNTLYAFNRDLHRRYGYKEVATPLLNKKALYLTSGHWTHYRDDMFVSPMSYLRGESQEALEGTEVFGIKPMNCPNAMIIFGSKTRSYRDLPLRLSDTDVLHRFELSGTLNGLFRTREFRQDDAHVFIRVDQIETEFQEIMALTAELYKPFYLTYRLRFGTRPEGFMGEAGDWDVAETALRSVLEKSGREFFEAEGEGAFYGPKVDILMKDSLGREWQTGTIQLDFQQPKNFGLTYINDQGDEVTPAVMHRAIYGSFERFIGILTEHYAGAFPLWLAPVQIMLLPISDKHNGKAKALAEELTRAGLRAETDIRSERLQAKIRESTLQKVPYMGIIGDKEIAEEVVSVRTLAGDDLGKVKISELARKLKEEIGI